MIIYKFSVLNYMGIKHFYMWFRTRFSNHIRIVDSDNSVNVDNLMIDMNGLFHTSAQKIYQYGDYKIKRSFLRTSVKKPKIGNMYRIRLYKDVCTLIEKYIRISNPRKRLVMCIDGVAPRSKQNQQRKRRFKTLVDRTITEIQEFDSNSITPGTQFMDHLSKYIDWYIRKQISEGNPIWKDLEIVFSTEKTAGEGEHKLMSYIRTHRNDGESYCICGADSDLVMLALGTFLPNISILREDNYNKYVQLIDVNGVGNELANVMQWEGIGKEFNPKWSIYDFIFLCFLVGNDFLPNIPALEIIEGGIDIILDVYKNVCREYGHITMEVNGNLEFNIQSLRVFLGTLSQYEKGILEQKLTHGGSFFPDEILNRCATFDQKITVNIEKYREGYYRKKLSGVNITQLGHQYVDGMRWILIYYIRGVSDWTWSYPQNYAPFGFDIAESLDCYTPSLFDRNTTPDLPYQQLLCVLPRQSSQLLPYPLHLLFGTESCISHLFPDTIEIDMEGRRREWEGLVVLPIIDFDKVHSEYRKLIRNVSEKDKKRNRFMKSLRYVFDNEAEPRIFKSYYGDILCKVKTSLITF